MKEKIDNNLWRNILAEISQNITTEISYRTWFLHLVPLYVEENTNTMTFASPEGYKIEVLKKHYIKYFEDAVKKVCKKKYSIVILHKSQEEIEQIISSPESGHPPAAVNTPRGDEYFLNPRYNFENFVVGDNNKYAHAVSLAVAEAPASVYNPLYIYGGSGLGKTHLMHAIGHFIMNNNPNMKVLYVSSEMFTNDLVSALMSPTNVNSKVASLRNKYRDIDVLLIDDIQFIEGKESTQTEFFHTFNDLFESGKQIVISSDRHPSKLRELDERLTSRFQWNVVADIQPPDLETRVAILRNKAEQEGLDINDSDLLEVIDLIAEKVKFNIRELESALTRVISFSTVFKKKITVKFAKENLKDIFSTSTVDISCESIKKVVCKKYNIKITDIESSSRKKQIAYPRQVAMYLCRELTDLSLPKIGKAFGGRDHTTVLHACEKISELIKTDSIVADEIKILKEEF